MSRTFYHTPSMDTNYLSVGKAERRVSLRRQDRVEAAARYAEMLDDEAAPVDFSSYWDEISEWIWENDGSPAALNGGFGWENTDFCEVCRRVTDHVAEHDELVALGMARYEDGNVILTNPNQPLPNVGWSAVAYAV